MIKQKFGRAYRLTIDPKDGLGPIIIALPFTVRFSLQRDISSDLNYLTLEIYNLSREHRDRLFQDRYVAGPPAKTVSLELGYSTLYRVFDGFIFRASTTREGTNLVTRVEVSNGRVDIATSQVFQTMQSGQTVSDVLKYLMGQFSNLTPGAIGSYPQTLNRPVVLNGSTWNLLKQYSNGTVYIDNGRIYCLADSEVLRGTTVINEQTGILGTPCRDQGFLQVNTLLEPGVDLKQTVALQSTVQPNYDGTYSVIGIQHRGVISAAVNGDCRSVFKLLAPNQFGTFNVVQPLV